MNIPPVLATILTVTGIILALPLIVSVAWFGLGVIAHPDDVKTNTENGGDAMVKAIEYELPAWTDPVGFVLAFMLAALLVLGWAFIKSGGGGLL